jgi:hypothetical protein
VVVSWVLRPLLAKRRSERLLRLPLRSSHFKIKVVRRDPDIKDFIVSKKGKRFLMAPLG